MFDQAFEPHTLQSEAVLRADIEALEHQRVDLVEARLDFWRWSGLLFIPLLLRIGQGWVVWLTALVLVADVVLTVILGSWLVAILSLGLVAVILIYESNRLEDWVGAHNARLDNRIRALLETATTEGS